MPTEVDVNGSDALKFFQIFSLKFYFFFCTRIQSTLYRLLVFAVILCLARCESENENENASRDVCTTQACKVEAKNILAKLDDSVDPCDDFYLFACGNFINQSIIPDDKTSFDVSTALDDQMREQLNEILNRTITDTDIQPFVLSKKFYRACIHEGLAG